MFKRYGKDFLSPTCYHKNMDLNLTCPSCHNPIDLNFYFCPNCGKKLKEKALSTSLEKQIVLYLVSFFLPPFGLGSALKYLHQTDSSSKRIGIFAIILTFISIAITIWLFASFMSNLNQTLNSQLNPYQNLKY